MLLVPGPRLTEKAYMSLPWWSLITPPHPTQTCRASRKAINIHFKVVYMWLNQSDHFNWFVSNCLFAILRIWRDVVGRRLFEGMVVRDVVSWNTLVSGYSLCGDVDATRWVFDQIEEKNLVTWSTMATGYTRVGKLDVARWLFYVMPERNVVSLNAIIAGYTQNEKYSEVIDLFYQMLEVGDGGRGRRVKPNNVTLVSVLSSCALDLGKWIDRFINQNKMELNVFLGNALADMFAKCGCVEECKRVLEKIWERDVISWSIIISGFAMYGQVEEAFRYFLKMLECRVKPNEITFMGCYWHVLMQEW
ncbi:hypothetical protein GIB67_002975 [Kingdonia uniflora]|uniref:Pentatricopeptide repeat-containing protein n=1 Tax=Kingdonia uniflora TaxID=39325 RepID=A0A7J7MDL8_9MAGN|nr:hypothetical protein GIB67_002975 [Kingdonia uniflora]